jgi:competence protein ComEA
MFKKFLKDYFSFTRSQKNGILVLISLIILIIIVRLALPHFRSNRIQDFSEFQEEISEFEKSLTDSSGAVPEKQTEDSGPGLFFFDPNTVSAADLERLDLSPFVIENIIKYREKGGKFVRKTDLMKIYGLDSADYQRLENYIQIKEPEKLSHKNEYRSENNEDRFAPIPLNLSDSIDLIRIKGLGPVLSGRIVKYRKLLGGYVRKEQLLEVYGFTPERFTEVKEAIYIDTTNIIPIFLNSVDEETLGRHPYLNIYQARAIIHYREISGRFNRIDEISENHLLPGDILEKIRPYLTLD